ncbi:uncharacterized protein LOC117113429 [Anneissia japonica]|uniref:uncharacterized protein LOC117113429 n=1 Tax=Anneissia japonica TaxID=1529436 RepID=UPI0014257034|nr:uncharacterized protein LOC117113429 [Anneissia japonica]
MTHYDTRMRSVSTLRRGQAHAVVWKRRAHVKFVYVGSLSWKTKGSVSSQHVNKKHSRNFIPISSLGDFSSPERNSSQEEYLDLLSQKTFFANTSRSHLDTKAFQSMTVETILVMSTGTR